MVARRLHSWHRPMHGAGCLRSAAPSRPPRHVLVVSWTAQGLVPALAVGSVVVLIFLVAVIRAAAVTRSEHRGGLCFLAHLGINVGKVRAPAP